MYAEHSKNLKLLSTGDIKIIFPFLFFIFFILSNTSQSQITTIPSIIKEINDTAVFIDQDSVTGAVTTHLQSVIYYYKTVVFLSSFDTVTHYSHIQRYYKDQFLEIYNETKILPASKIYGFQQGINFYRSAVAGNRNFVFAKRIMSGKMSLYSADRILVADEVDVIGHGNNGTYNNTMLITDNNANKMKRSDVDYFFTIHGSFNDLQPLLPDMATAEKLKSCPAAAEYLQKYFPDKYKTVRRVSRFLFIGSLLANVAYLVGPEGNKSDNTFLVGSLVVTGVAFLALTLSPRSRPFNEKEIRNAVAIYNSCK